MNPIDNCNVIRPLLSINRFETGKLCSFWQLPIYPDISNQKIKFLRNRVRKQLLPFVKFFFNLKVENVLLQLAEIVEAEDHQMNQVAKDFFIAFHNIGYYNFTNVSATHHNRYVWVSSINFIKQTSFTTYLSSLGCSLIRLDQLLVPQTLAASQAILHLTGASHTTPLASQTLTEGRGGAPVPPKVVMVVCGLLPSVCWVIQENGNYGTQSNAVLVHILPYHPTSQTTLPVQSKKVVCDMWYEATKVIPSSMFYVSTYLRYAEQEDGRSTCSKLVIRWILTIFASLNTKGVKRKNTGCKAIPVSLSNLFARPLYPTSDEGMPFSKVCMSKLCMNYVFDNRGSENMWYRYTKGGNYNKPQKLLLTKLMKQNFEFRKLALFSKMCSARNVLQKKGSSNNKNNIKKNSNKFIKKPVEKYVEDVLIYNFFLYFEMLKPEKKEIYWPIIISFLPTAFQRRVTKLFLINQDWKKIRYSQVFNFLAKKKNYVKICHLF